MAALRGQLRVAGNGPTLTSEGWFWRRFGAGFGLGPSRRLGLSSRLPRPALTRKRRFPQNGATESPWWADSSLVHAQGYRGESSAVTGRCGPLTAALLTVTRAGGRRPTAATGRLSVRKAFGPGDGWELVVRNP